LPTADSDSTQPAQPVEPVEPAEPLERAEPVAPIEYAVLCGPEDAAAVWAAHELTRRGLGVRIVTTEELVYSTSLVHTVGPAGCTVAVRLADGKVLGPHLRGTLNRLLRIPRNHLAATSETDRDYVLMELHAVLTSLLVALPGVVLGRADPRGLCGAWWRPAEWMVAAAGAGLSTVGYRSGGADATGPTFTVLVVAGRVVAPDGVALPAGVEAACRVLGERHGGGVLGIELVRDSWLFVGATPWPDLRLGGTQTVDVLHAALSARERVPA
jgi:hypothetical protein